MIKVNIFNMNEFLKTVNECVGAVKIIDSDGKKRDITRHDDMQWELRCRHRANRNSLKLTLDVPNSKDYLKIVFFSIGDC